MMNNDNSITVETKLFGYIAENAQSSRFAAMTNKLFKENSINAMVIPMNIRPDDIAFTISQMRGSKLSGAVIATEYQEEAFLLLDRSAKSVSENGYCDFIRIDNGMLNGELIMPDALARYADRDDFEGDIALNALSHYFYDLITEEKQG